MNLGKAINFCRVSRDMSRTELSERAGISISYLSILISSKRSPKMSTVGNIARALDIPLFLLIFLAEMDGTEEAKLVYISEEPFDKVFSEILKLLGKETEKG